MRHWDDDFGGGGLRSQMSNTHWIESFMAGSSSYRNVEPEASRIHPHSTWKHMLVFVFVQEIVQKHIYICNLQYILSYYVYIFAYTKLETSICFEWIMNVGKISWKLFATFGMHHDSWGIPSREAPWKPCQNKRIMAMQNALEKQKIGLHNKIWCMLCNTCGCSPLLCGLSWFHFWFAKEAAKKVESFVIASSAALEVLFFSGSPKRPLNFI